ncbi:sigma-70 family RNA polymerase sigma factor [Ravibacter arvi]|uniref:RNA polymerase sigma factor n=1 Tax=Ravibacter arvi TaxID=2051041 RepID=UPI0031ECED7F
MKAGSREAFEKLIRVHYQELFVYGRRLINHPDFVKDCIHDLFVHIWEKRSSIGDTDNVRLYLLKSLRNRIVKQIRKDTRMVGLVETAGLDGNEAEWSAEETIVHSENAMLTTRNVELALHTLTNRQREVIHLRYYKGMSNEQIASIMNISKPAVANLIHSGVKSLRTVWKTFLLLFVSLFSSL